jgi:hypothetical protein
VVPIGDSRALGEALLAIIDRPDAYRGDPDEIAARFHPDFTARGYEALFARLIAEKSGGRASTDGLPE